MISQGAPEHPTIKTIVCLANSWKNGGRCVAGIEWAERGWTGWLRPVSPRAGHSVLKSECGLDDGSALAPLDVVRLGLARHAPLNYQTENWTLDPSCRWRRVGRLSWHDLGALEDRRPELWGIGQSSGIGRNDRIRLHEAESHTHSLMLVRVQDPVIRVVAEGPRRTVRAGFTYGGNPYDLSVTDPICHLGFRGRGTGEYPLDATHMTISLAEPLNGYCYKVVAAVLGRGVRGEGVV